VPPTDLRRQFADIAVWKRGSERAPHKPLLLLYALARCSRGEDRLIPYADVDTKLRELLVEFGPARKSYHPEYPFWRLRNDGIWELENAEQALPRTSNTDARRSELLKHGVAGGLQPYVYEQLRSDPQLLGDVVHGLLDANFPPSRHDDILAAVGLDVAYVTSRRRGRDPEFRQRILTAYEYRCAVCGYDVRFGNRELGLEAAHIKWHQAGGPDTEVNGLALCVLHHKLFDCGAYSLTFSRTVQVSQLAHGTKGFSEWLLDFHGHPLRPPQSRRYQPEDEFVSWHQREVFRGPAREAESAA